MKVKEESEKVGLKLNVQKTKIMASSPITSWQIDGETMETVRDYFLGLENHCRWWLQPKIKRCLLLGRKVMTNLDSILKSRDITLPTKIRLVQAMVFPVVMYGCESWTIKKAECWRTDAFELCWRRLLRVPWTARRSNRSILKEISSEYSLEGLMLRLKLQYLGHLMWSTDAGNGWRREEKGSTEDEVIGCITDSTDMSMSKLRELVMDRKAWRAAVRGVTKSHTWLSDWSELNWTELSCLHQQCFWVRTTHRSILQIREILLHLVNYKCLLFCVSKKPPSDANAASAKPMLCVARVENEVWKISRAPLNEEASSSCR